MFNEGDSHWLLITVMSSHTDTFNTESHSKSATQCQEYYQHPLTWGIIHIFTHRDTLVHTQVVQEACTCLVGNGLSSSTKNTSRGKTSRVWFISGVMKAEKDGR